MSGFVAAVRSKVPQDCQAASCEKKGCSASLAGLAEDRVLIDLDCAALDIPQDHRRCDYVFVEGDNDPQRIEVIELKSGAFKGNEVAEQLQGGAAAADRWLPRGTSFQFVPVLVHRKGVHRLEYRRLNQRKIKLRGLERQTKLIKCGGLLTDALAKR